MAMQQMEPPKMDTTDKQWWLNNHFDEYRRFCDENNGNNIGYMFPDGSQITNADSDDFVFF